MPQAPVLIRGVNPRRNLPLATSRKRGESNFLCAFERAYRATITTTGIAGRDFEVAGYGIADWIWMGWRSQASSEDATAYSLEKLPPSLRLQAFELKITDWRKALRQAFRYSYFADRAMVVVPPQTLSIARRHLEVFKRLQIGLWGFDAKTGKINKAYTPRAFKPRNAGAKARAIELILSRAKLCKIAKTI